MIQYIFGGRGRGKTTSLVQISCETGSPIVTSSEVSARRILESVANLDAELPRVYTLREVLSGKLRGTHVKEILLDDAELVIDAALKAYLGVPVKMAVIGNEASN